jgi:hypothetical protein
MKTKTWRSTAVAVLALAIVNMGFMNIAQAGIVGTESMVVTGRAAQLAIVHAQLNRADVRAELEKRGVDSAVLDQRVANLSDSELASFSKQLQDAPAGGDVLVILGVVFLVLLVLELVGVIDIFKKIP